MVWFRALFSLWLATAALFAAPAIAATVTLPRTAPVPEPDDRPSPLPPTPPAPQEKPATPADKQDLPGPETPEKIPVPEQKPAEEPSPAKPGTDDQKPEIPVDPRSDVRPIDPMPGQETACRERLTALGVEFEELKPVRDEENGCAVPYPLKVTKLGTGIDLTPEATMNCQLAEAAARFMAQIVAPAAKAQFGAELKSVDQASAYVCRPRHNGLKLSEHAFGNALDIARFTLADDVQIDVEPEPIEKNAQFLAAIRKAACGPFKTVLGPGSDPDHELHLHLDLQPRRNGSTFCQ